METTSSKKTLWIMIGVVALALIIWWMLAPKPAASPVLNENTASTETTSDVASIGAQLKGLNETDMNAELQDVTQDTSKL